MSSSIDEQVIALRTTGGFCRDAEVSAIEISGPQSAEFLQARLSNNVLALASGQGQQTCFLDRQARILCAVTLHKLADLYWLIVARSQCRNVLGLLEEFRFREQVQFRTIDHTEFFSVHSPKAELLLANAGVDRSVLPREPHAIARMTIYHQSVVVIRCSSLGEPGLIFAANETGELEKSSMALNMIPLCPDACRTARIESGNLCTELSGYMLAETGLESQSVSFTKGCFPGQEVLARIRTYGAPRQGLVGIIVQHGLEGDCREGSIISSGNTLQCNDKDIGTVVAACFSPTLQKHIAIAMVQREYRVPCDELHVLIGGAPYIVSVTQLPLVTRADRDNQAKALYARSLNEFARGSETDAIDMLRRVIELNPLFADAYEALGVVLARHDQLDEAISLMRQLGALDPESIMAHANLSVYYMQKGDKIAAEDEKAMAMSIRMGQMAKSVANEQAQRAKKAESEAEAAQRMEMFSQVLEIDPEDFLANAGLGSVYVEIGHYQEALEPLKKALAKRPNHTVAYVALGQALEELGRKQEAVETYTKGVAVAAQRGDGEPLKKMQIRLERLISGATR